MVIFSANGQNNHSIFVENQVLSIPDFNGTEALISFPINLVVNWLSVLSWILQFVY